LSIKEVFEIYVITRFNGDGWCVVASCDDGTYGDDGICVFRHLFGEELGVVLHYSQEQALVGQKGGHQTHLFVGEEGVLPILPDNGLEYEELVLLPILPDNGLVYDQLV
jgi:hypothetical protein